MIRAVHFEAAGRDWALRFGFGALERIEQMFDISVSDLHLVLQPEGGAPRLGDLAKVLRCGLIEQEATAKDVETMFDELGVAAMVDLIGRALQAAFGQADEAGDASPAGKKKGAAR